MSSCPPGWLLLIPLLTPFRNPFQVPVPPVHPVVDVQVRPWADASALTDEFEPKAKAARDPDAQIELATWCERHALFVPLQALLEPLLAKDPEHAKARALLRQVKSGTEGRWIPEELTRFAAEPAAYQSPLAALTPAQQKELLRLKDQSMKVMGSSGVFDLRSDVAADAMALYHKTFNGFYLSLKRRFPVWVGSKVDVMVFANRADYLRYYRENVGAGGEHVSGFYSDKSVVLYDDPGDRAGVVNVARHEGTHLVLDLFYEGARIPGWLHEGMACYFAAECEQSLGTYTAGLFDLVWTELAAKRTVDFEKVVRRPYKDFTIQDYAVSWSWIHFLNVGASEERFQEFLSSVRKLPRDDGKPDEFARSVCDLFLKEFPFRKLEAEWRRYFVDQYALASPQQALDCARWLLTKKGYDSLQLQERAVDVALRALRGLDAAKEPEVVAADAELRIAAMILRFRGMEASPPLLRLALRVIRDRIAQLPGGRGEIEKARLAYRTLSDLKWKFVEGETAVPFDLRAHLLAKSMDAAPADAEALRAIVVLCDDLVRIARQGAAAELALDPLSRRALFIWLFLAVDVAPDGLVEIFPRLKLLLEVEPDDRNLAAFALCYLALGDRKWARHLWADAKARSFHPESLGSFSDYFEPAQPTR